jgi:hypothetical protein
MTRASPLLAGIGLLALIGCTKPLPMSREATADAAACRARADEIYLKQNRALMSVRDQRDVPFAATGISGNTTQGLGDLYGRDQMLASCLNSVGPASNAGNTTPNSTSPTMSPSSPEPDSALTPQ